MGRFASTAELYEQFRPPYPPEFFRTVAERLQLSKQHALIRAGHARGRAESDCPRRARGPLDRRPGRGPSCRHRRLRYRHHRPCLALDGAARARPDVRAAGQAGRRDRRLRIVLRAGRRQRLARRIQHGKTPLVGRRLVVGIATGRARAARAAAAALEGTGFQVGEKIRVETTHRVSVSDLAQRVLTFSSSSPAALGDRVDAMLADIEARLSPFGRDGLLTETVLSAAQVARR